MRIRGAVALVTGASSGIGRAVAELLAAYGAQVLVHGRDRAALSVLAERIGGVAIAADLTEPDAVPRLVTTALAYAGRLDVLVANAGVGWAGDLSTMDDETLDRLVRTNLVAPMRLTRAVLPAMLQRRTGALVYVSSIAGRTGVPGEAVYAATKAGLDVFADSLRLELRGTGVCVGVFVPGVVATSFFDRRGLPYQRQWPRPVPAELAAAAVLRLIRTGAAQAYRPRWLRIPVAVRATMPGPYRWLAGRFGGSTGPAPATPPHRRST